MHYNENTKWNRNQECKALSIKLTPVIGCSVSCLIFQRFKFCIICTMPFSPLSLLYLLTAFLFLVNSSYANNKFRQDAHLLGPFEEQFKVLKDNFWSPDNMQRLKELLINNLPHTQIYSSPTGIVKKENTKAWSRQFIVFLNKMDLLSDEQKDSAETKQWEKDLYEKLVSNDQKPPKENQSSCIPFKDICPNVGADDKTIMRILFPKSSLRGRPTKTYFKVIAPFDEKAQQYTVTYANVLDEILGCIELKTCLDEGKVGEGPNGETAADHVQLNRMRMKALCVKLFPAATKPSAPPIETPVVVLPPDANAPQNPNETPNSKPTSESPNYQLINPPSLVISTDNGKDEFYFTFLLFCPNKLCFYSDNEANWKKYINKRTVGGAIALTVLYFMIQSPLISNAIKQAISGRNPPPTVAKDLATPKIDIEPDTPEDESTDGWTTVICLIMAISFIAGLVYLAWYRHKLGALDEEKGKTSKETEGKDKKKGKVKNNQMKRNSGKKVKSSINSSMSSSLIMVRKKSSKKKKKKTVMRGKMDKGGQMRKRSSAVSSLQSNLPSDVALSLVLSKRSNRKARASAFPPASNAGSQVSDIPRSAVQGSALSSPHNSTSSSSPNVASSYSQ